MVVSVDLGASGTRYASNNGKIRTLLNNMVTLASPEPSFLEPYDESVIEESLEVIIRKSESSSIFPVHVLSGSMASRYAANNDRPSVNSHKYKQKINYIQSVLTVAVSKLYAADDRSLVNLYIAVPPVEVREAQKEFSAGLVGSYSVQFPKYNGGCAVSFTINSVKCYEEAVMASTSFFFDMNGRVNEAAKNYTTGAVLSLDIGASTSDLAIVMNGKYLEKSGQTYKTGGNVVRDFVSEYITSEYGFDPDQEMADRAVIEGRLQMGDSFVDIGSVVSQAKAELAKSLISNIETYFKRINIPVQKIRAIMVSGGGSKQSQYMSEDGNMVKTSEPMSYFVTESMKEWSPNTVVLNYGEDARLANVKGLYVRAMFEEAREAQKKASVSAETLQAASNMQVYNESQGGTVTA